MEKQWFYLSPNTFLWCKNTKGLVYNSISGDSFRFVNDESIRQITDDLANLSNLYCIEIKDVGVTKPSVARFIEIIQASQAGKLVKQIPGQPNPILLPPLLNLQSDVERLRKDTPFIVGEHVLAYLHEVFLHVNTFDDKTHRIRNLEFFRIEIFLDSLLFSSIGHIHLCGEDIAAYPDLLLLIDKLDKIHLKKSIHLKSEKLEKLKDLPDIFTSAQFQLVVEVDNVSDTNLNFINAELTNRKINLEWYFFIKNEKEYELTELLIEKYDLQNAEINPHYTGENLQFFEDNIYLTEVDLQSPGLSKREVFAHQALNTNDFGKITIMSDGIVYANVFHEPLGTIDDDIRELIYNEMDKGTSWRRIRDMKPCCDCVYQWLCPSPSNYELEIGKPNLCHVIPEMYVG